MEARPGGKVVKAFRDPMEAVASPVEKHHNIIGEHEMGEFYLLRSRVIADTARFVAR